MRSGAKRVNPDCNLSVGAQLVGNREARLAAHALDGVDARSVSLRGELLQLVVDEDHCVAKWLAAGSGVSPVVGTGEMRSDRIRIRHDEAAHLRHNDRR